jgi:hypothetical protein
VDGYTDSQPIHSLRFPSNWELSTARAQAVADLLGAVPRSKLTVTGHAASNPIASNDTAAGRDANRRTELVVSNVATATNLPPAPPPQPAPPATPQAGPATDANTSPNSAPPKPPATEPRR